MATSKAKKDTYTQYKNENRALTNKLKKLVRHCKKFPNDEVGKANLERIKKDGYTPRSTPKVPGSNPTIAKIRLGAVQGGPKTAGEQLSKLLGIPEPKFRKRSLKRGAAAVRIKKGKDVKKS
jgi:hypothetical protein